MSTLVAKSSGSFGAHMKKQNVFFYFSALTSVALIALMFVPWIIIPSSQAGQHWLVELVTGFAPSLRGSLPAFLTENNAVSMWDLLIESINIPAMVNRIPTIFGEFTSGIGTLGLFPAIGKLFKSVWGLIASVELLVFLIPVFAGIIVVHIMYLRSIFRPETDPFFPGTVTVLLAGIMMFLFLFGSDLIFSTTLKADLTGSDLPWTLLGLHFWTPVPYIWFGLTLLQKWLFAKLAHKKKVISYT